MEATTEIHGLPTPPLGYRLAVKGDVPAEGMQAWQNVSQYWAPCLYYPERPLSEGMFYAIPLDDGYAYHEAGTIIREGDEYQIGESWCKYAEWTIGEVDSKHPLRRPKAKPSPLAPGRNINGLTEANVETHLGWRLITEGESTSPPEDAQFFLRGIGWGPREDPTGKHAAYNCDYRTKAPLPAAEERRHYEVCGTSYLLTVRQREALEILAESCEKEGR